MTTITIPLSDESLARLRQLAQKEGVSAEELLRTHVEQFLEQPTQKFQRAATYVLNKNRELYRRLA